VQWAERAKQSAYLRGGAVSLTGTLAAIVLSDHQGRCKLIVGLLSQPPHPREAASIVPQTQIIQFLYM
jgi:hypothetical protein